MTYYTPPMILINTLGYACQKTMISPTALMQWWCCCQFTLTLPIEKRFADTQCCILLIQINSNHVSHDGGQSIGEACLNLTYVVPEQQAESEVQ